MPPTSTPITGASTAAGYHNRHVAEGVKPYRRYRGGRVKGRVPLDRGKRAAPTAPAPAGPKSRRRWWRWAVVGVAVLVLLTVLWAFLGYLSFASGVDDANERLPRRAYARLAEPVSMLSDPATILIIGTDGGRQPGRGNSNRSDSLMLLRTDPEHHRLSYLSIPRDMSVEIPGYGTGKINAANQFGGPALTIATVRQFTGLKIHHVVVLDFDGFKELIDALGGVEIDVPKPILSNKFDCPYATEARCEQWPGWRFGKGKQEMDGRRELIYSRIRQNQLDPADNDLTRTDRQQAVIEAMTGKLAGPGTFMRLPFIDDNSSTRDGNGACPRDSIRAPCRDRPPRWQASDALRGHEPRPGNPNLPHHGRPDRA